MSGYGRDTEYSLFEDRCRPRDYRGVPFDLKDDEREYLRLNRDEAMERLREKFAGQEGKKERR